MTTSLYNCRSTGLANFTFTKFDADLNVESSYQTTEKECTCPAGAKPTCRHRTMLPLFITAGHVDDGYFLDWSTRMWRKPLTGDNGGVADHRKMGKADDLGAAPPSNASEAAPEAPAPAPDPTAEQRMPAAPAVVQRAGALPRRIFKS